MLAAPCSRKQNLYNLLRHHQDGLDLVRRCGDAKHEGFRKSQEAALDSRPRAAAGRHHSKQLHFDSGCSAGSAAQDNRQRFRLAEALKDLTFLAAWNALE